MSHLPKAESLTALLSRVSEKLKEHDITIKTLFDTLAGRGYPALMVFLSLPFCLPIQIPGFSTPFGLLLAFIGLRIAFFEHHVWWPEWVMKKKIPHQTLQKIINKTTWLLSKVQKFIHPRYVFICIHPVLHRMHGITIAILGFILALPLPIPLSNVIAALGILSIGLGLLEDDGLFVCLGYVFALICFVFFAFITFSIHYLIMSL